MTLDGMGWESDAAWTEFHLIPTSRRRRLGVFVVYILYTYVYNVMII